MREPAFCICENKDADQLCGNRKADQRLCFRYTVSTIPLLPKFEISSVQPSSVVVQPGLFGPGRKPRRPVFSQRGSIKARVVEISELETRDIILYISSKQQILAQADLLLAG